MNSHPHIPVILEHLFLVITNVVINCRNGVVKLSFSNITIELNIVEVCKQPNINIDESQDINYIEEIHKGDIILLSISNPLELELIINDGFLERLNFENIINIIKCLTDLIVHILQVGFLNWMYTKNYLQVQRN